MTYHDLICCCMQFAAVEQVCKQKQGQCALMVETKGPDIRTAMLQKHKRIDLVEGQDIFVVAVGDEYVTWEGFKDAETGETKIGVSYSDLCKSVSKGSKILLAGASIAIEVMEILSETELRGRVLNSKKLGERKTVSLPGAEISISAISAQDKKDLAFVSTHGIDFVAVSFVQSAQDISDARAALAAPAGKSIKVLAKIENTGAVRNFDSILKACNGVIIARAQLGQEIPVEKVAIVQKMITVKACIAGKPVFVAADMLASMVSNVMPTRAEMTDAANAAFDGMDSSENSVNQFDVNIAVSLQAQQVLFGIAQTLQAFGNEFRQQFGI